MREGEFIFLGVLLLKTRHRLSPALLTFSSVTKSFPAWVLWQGVIWTRLFWTISSNPLNDDFLVEKH